MAYTRRSRTTRRSSRSRSYAPRTSYRSRSVRSTRRAPSRRRSSSGSGRTIRIEVVQVQPSEVARPASVMMKPAAAPKKAKF